jgi:hypothetical protein
MPALALFQWLQSRAWTTALRESRYMFPLVETIHVLGLAGSVGLILVADLRLIGVFLRDESVADVMTQHRRWMWMGFMSMFLSGALLFCSEAAKCYMSGTFRAKMVFLLLAGLNALMFESTLGRRVSLWGEAADTPFGARFAGWMSLACWAGVILFGRWTAYGLK